MNNEAIIILEQVRMSMLGTPHQLAVDVRIRASQFVAFVGSSRSGKSLILELMAGIVSPEAGRVMVLGHEWTADVNDEPNPVRLRLGAVLQQPGLLSNMTLFNNVALPLRYHRASIAERDCENLVMAQLDRLALAPMRDRFPAELNHGEARRGAIARALMLDPQVLLLDDPVAGLDAEMVLRLKAYMEERRAEQVLTIVVALRSFSPFIEKADRLVLLRDGRVEADGTRAALTEVVAPPFREYLG